MRIGLLVDGVAEVESLPTLFAQLRTATGHTLLTPLRPAIHPIASIERIAARCTPQMEILRGKRADRVIVVLDREGRTDCPGAFARQVETAIAGRSSIPVAVVVKDRCFENWLISDPDAISTLPSRFRLAASVELAARTDRADQQDALRALKDSAIRKDYNKVLDSKRILAVSNVGRMAQGSRSFRRFLRCIDHPLYRNQSVRPVLPYG